MSDAELLYAAAHWLIGQERHADAAIVLRAMIEATPTDERGWLALGTCHEAIGQRRLAIVMFDAGLLAAAPAPRCAIAKARLLREEDDDAADDALDVALEHAESAGDAESIALVRGEMAA